MTSATDILRRLLDERDEYYKTSGNRTWWGRPIDRQTGKPINVFHYQAQPMGEDRLFVELQLATPEQAIAATLGATDANPTQAESSGTCRIEYHYGEWYCTGCGVMVGTCDPDSELCVDGNYVDMWNYCPNCGRRCVG